MFVVLTDEGMRLEGKVSVAQRAVVCRAGPDDKDLATMRRELKDLTDRIAATGDACRVEPT